jgi:hypothetical protein
MIGTITNADDLIDSRDVIKRIEELRDTIVTDDDERSNGPDQTDERTELAALEALQTEASGVPDWPHGVTLVRECYFKRYAQDLAEDIGAIKSEMAWPYTCIDWDQASDELKQDYTSVDFDGESYWVRA